MSNDNYITSRLPLLIILFVLIAIITYLQWPKAEVKEKAFQRVISVKTATVELAEFTDSIEAIGTARANEQVLITSKHSDLVDEIFFTDGQIVNKGDVLVKLNNQEELAKVSELNANLSESMAQFKRFQELLNNKATSKSLVDQQEAKTKAIAAQLQSARTKLDDLTIKSPFAGVLGFREISVGAYINAGSVITSLDDLSVIKVDFNLPERFLTTIKVGQTITAFNSAYKNQQFIGKISSLDSRINPTTRSLKVRATIANKALKLRPGMLLNLNLVRQKETLLQLPESTIFPIEDKHFVFVVIDGPENQKIAQRKTITIGRRQAGIVEVLRGIEQGEQVVTQGTLKLRDGAVVKVLNQKESRAGEGE
jgi:membrane fusion protein (multidrug efflux system)